MQAGPKYIAYSSNTLPIFAFNEKGQVDAFLFDDTSVMTERLGLDKKQQIPLSEIANANILFRITQDLGFQPGEDNQLDQFIKKTLIERMSDSIDDKEKVADEIITSWNTIAAHPLSQKYAGFNSSFQTQTLIAFHGAYESMLHDYITLYLSTLSQFDQIETWVFLQAAELLKSTFEGRVFSVEFKKKTTSLLQLADECKSDIQDSSTMIEKIKGRLEKEQGTWYVDVKGVIEFEIQCAIEEAVEEKENTGKLENIRKALQCLLDEKYDQIPKDKEIKELLKETISLLKLKGKFYAQIRAKENKPSNNELRTKIRGIIQQTAHEMKFSLKDEAPQVTPPLPQKPSDVIMPAPIPTSRNDFQALTTVDLLALAKSDNSAHAEKLCSILLSRKKHTPVLLLKAIRDQAAFGYIRDTAAALFAASLPPSESSRSQSSQPRITNQFNQHKRTNNHFGSVEEKEEKTQDEKVEALEEQEADVVEVDKTGSPIQKRLKRSK